MVVRVTIGSSRVLRGADPVGSGCGGKQSGRWVQQGHFGGLFGLPAGQVDGRVEITVDDQPTDLA